MVLQGGQRGAARRAVVPVQEQMHEVHRQHGVEVGAAGEVPRGPQAPAQKLLGAVVVVPARGGRDG
eukprot:613608-Pyramimonas_sp.AAC.1